MAVEDMGWLGYQHLFDTQEDFADAIGWPGKTICKARIWHFNGSRAAAKNEWSHLHHHLEVELAH
jgi:hypothetical protein